MNGRFLVSLQKIPKSCYHIMSLQESEKKKNTRICYWCHICVGTLQSPLSNVDRVKKQLRRLVGDELFIHPASFIPDEMLLDSHHSVAVTMSDVRTGLHFFSSTS